MLGRSIAPQSLEQFRGIAIQLGHRPRIRCDQRLDLPRKLFIAIGTSAQRAQPLVRRHRHGRLEQLLHKLPSTHCSSFHMCCCNQARANRQRRLTVRSEMHSVRAMSSTEHPP